MLDVAPPSALMYGFYHGADLDGQACGAMLRRRFPCMELRPIDHGDPFPFDELEPGAIVYMADFSLQPFSQMLRLADRQQLVWIDHHASSMAAAQDAERDLAGRQETGRAACELCWETLFPDSPMPRGIQWLGRYDVWDHVDPAVLPFQFGMRAQGDTGPDAPVWRQLFQEHVPWESRVLEEGRVVLRYLEKENSRLCETSSFETRFDGLAALAINRAFIDSRTFVSAWDRSRHDLMLAFYWDGRRWRVSLYTERGDLDLGALANRYGGGGHAKAAGFECDDLPFTLQDERLPPVASRPPSAPP